MEVKPFNLNTTQMPPSRQTQAITTPGNNTNLAKPPKMPKEEISARLNGAGVAGMIGLLISRGNIISTAIGAIIGWFILPLSPHKPKNGNQ